MQNKRRRPKKWYEKINPSTVILIAVILVVIIIAAVGISKKRAGKNEAFDNKQTAAESSSVISASEKSENTDIAAVSEAVFVSGTSEEAVSSSSSSEEAAAVPVPSETEDGSGQAGLDFLLPEMSATAAMPGWQSNNYGLWYSTDGQLCYYNGWKEIDGQTYHFDSQGYMDRGWKLIGGQSCYFDSHGVYVPDKDNSKMIAFTFDDGPSQGMDEILSLCEQYDCRVTFFMIGAQVETGGAVIPYIERYRCQVGNHSYSHTCNTGRDTDECVTDFIHGNDWIKSYNDGRGASVVRFPYGDYSKEQTAAVGMPNILWDNDTLDWESNDVEAIKQEFYEYLDDGNIVLMHDRIPESVEACRQIFPELISDGWQLVTVEELAAAKGYELKPGVTYYSFKAKNIAEGRVTDENE